jgi:hypothetical protein
MLELGFSVDSSMPLNLDELIVSFYIIQPSTATHYWFYCFIFALPFEIWSKPTLIIAEMGINPGITKIEVRNTNGVQWEFLLSAR